MSDRRHVELSDGEVPIVEIARSLDEAQLATLLEDFANRGGRDFVNGLKVGEELHRAHRTLQRLVVGLCLGIICGLSEQRRTDPRNEKAIETARKIAQMVEDGEFPLGMMI